MTKNKENRWQLEIVEIFGSKVIVRTKLISTIPSFFLIFHNSGRASRIKPLPKTLCLALKTDELLSVCDNSELGQDERRLTLILCLIYFEEKIGDQLKKTLPHCSLFFISINSIKLEQWLKIFSTARLYIMAHILMLICSASCVLLLKMLSI